VPDKRPTLNESLRKTPKLREAVFKFLDEKPPEIANFSIIQKFLEDNDP
jgi:hypothetical protein